MIICSICIIFAILGTKFFPKSLVPHFPRITVSVTLKFSCKEIGIQNIELRFQDDIRAVATQNGQVWTLSQVRRNPMNESGALIDVQDLPKFHDIMHDETHIVINEVMHNLFIQQGDREEEQGDQIFFFINFKVTSNYSSKSTDWITSIGVFKRC